MFFGKSDKPKSGFIDELIVFPLYRRWALQKQQEGQERHYCLLGSKKMLVN